MGKGIIFSVLASSVFGVLYFYSQLLHQFNGVQVFGWRMIALLPFLTLFMYLTKDLHRIWETLRRVQQQPMLLLGILATSALGGVQLWLFLWGPMNGRGMQVSLGYFLLPLVLVLVGAVFYKEKLSIWQRVAVVCAVLGVGHQVWQAGAIAWETVLVAVGYSAYFFLRRLIQTDHLGGFWLDNLFALPVAFYFVSTWHQPWSIVFEQPSLILIITGLGILSAVGLGSYILASRYLPMVLFGLLSYLEPVLLALASFAIGEKISSEDLLTYIPIWCAVALLVVEGSIHLYKKHQHNVRIAQQKKSLSKK